MGYSRSAVGYLVVALLIALPAASSHTLTHLRARKPNDAASGYNPIADNSTTCYTVTTGNNYCWPPNIGFDNSTDWSKIVTADPDTASYLCNCTTSCMSDWNKLWGKSRCGYLQPHHEDSDRFVWRRHAGSDSQLDLAAYAYDLGHVPYVPPWNKILLKQFNTVINVSTPYRMRMTLNETATVYWLYSWPADALLETQVIQKNNTCSNYNEGYLLGLYFGGDCPAPSNVTVCYEAWNATTSFA